MKQILLTCILIGGLQLVAAAQAANKSALPAMDNAARAATESLTAKYSLNADQAKQMYTVQLRKIKNLEEIQSLKNSDAKAYYAKLDNVQRGTLGSIRRILKTPQQVELYQKTQAEVRQLKAQKRKEMTLAGAQSAEIENALIDLYQE